MHVGKPKLVLWPGSPNNMTLPEGPFGIAFKGQKAHIDLFDPDHFLKDNEAAKAQNQVDVIPSNRS